MSGMICQFCKQRPATCHITQSADKDKPAKDLHVCGVCLQELGVDPQVDLPDIDDLQQAYAATQQDSNELNPHITINLNPEVQLKVEKPKEDNTATCPDCGMTWTQFRNKNRFGCPSCYDAFSGQLEKHFTDMHGEARHVGRVPRRAANTAEQLFAQRIHIQKQLDAAIAEEDYERAAVLRDQMKDVLRGDGSCSA